MLALLTGIFASASFLPSGPLWMIIGRRLAFLVLIVVLELDAFGRMVARPSSRAGSERSA